MGDEDLIFSIRRKHPVEEGEIDIRMNRPTPDRCFLPLFPVFLVSKRHEGKKGRRRSNII
jgi:hypothetical protein